ncbi:HNH endonuclease domain-containing protein [Advenella mimigardefordensis DPN7]|uniref:HNH endonuclease domain-containing protein n=2 Tax=Advenella mimigardefordensis TaxID=302406 RepID=W0PFN7_ADVMD|nr:HNH endonuclease domain-containing protein [Advenella mimigardefordensis DPN7]
MEHTFDITDVRYESDASAFWIKLKANGGKLGEAVELLDLTVLSELPQRGKLPKLSSRNAPWSRDELILALDLYMQHRESLPTKKAPEIAELSALLNQLGIILGRRHTDTYRNSEGVYMKLMNFRRLDPEYTYDGKKGLTRGNSDEVRVWALFAHDPRRLSEVAIFIRNGISEASGKDTKISYSEELEIEEAEEGKVATRVHRYRERDRRLVDTAKARALREHGRLFCTVCGFDFSKHYGEVGSGIIDVHHTKPIHTMQPGEKTKVADLVVLCSNCHRIIHSKRPWLTVDEIKSAIKIRTSVQ